MSKENKQFLLITEQKIKIQLLADVLSPEA